MASSLGVATHLAGKGVPATVCLCVGVGVYVHVHGISVRPTVHAHRGAAARLAVGITYLSLTVAMLPAESRVVFQHAPRASRGMVGGRGVDD